LSLYHQSVEETGDCINAACGQVLDVFQKYTVYSNNFIVCKPLLNIIRNGSRKKLLHNSQVSLPIQRTGI
jgi:hypothetical protein